MVEIVENNKPMGASYTFATRREAFTVLMKLERARPKSTFDLVRKP